MKYLYDFKTFERNTSHDDYKEGDMVLIRFEITDNEPIVTPVKIVKRHTKNSFTVTHNVEESQLKNFPDKTIKYSEIVAPYRMLSDPMDSDYVAMNPRINPDVSGMVPGGHGNPVNDITRLPANQNPSNDIAI